MLRTKLQHTLEKQKRKKPEKYNFEIPVSTTVFVYSLDDIIDSEEILRNIYWVRDNLGGVDMSKTIYAEDKDVIKTWHSGWYLHKDTNLFDNLIETVKEKVLECLGRGEERQVELQESWAMINKKGDQIVRHKHFDYGYSAVYYAYADKNANPLLFDNQLSITPKTNMLVCFPGYLYHRVPIIKDEQERVLMAFNLWCKG